MRNVSRLVKLAIITNDLNFHNDENRDNGAELIIANKELAYQSEEKADRAAELAIANKQLEYQSEEKADRAAELVIANKELAYQSEEKADRAAELVIANKELAYQSEEKADRAAELVIANKELAYQIVEKADRAAELIIANKELTYQNEEKGKRAAELIIANKELTYQNEEKEKRAAELIIANKELIFQNGEKEKRAAELIIANKAQGEFIVNISHELKTPLNVIFSTAQLFDMYCKSGSLDDKKDKIITYIDSIKQNSYRLSKLINNIVDLSKIEAGFFKLNLSNNNIVTVVEEIVMSVTTLTDSKGLNIVFDTDVEEKIIACDAEKIERIVLNLISNAIKFTDKGDEIFVAIKDGNEFVEISVKDNGIGIEEKDLEMIFDRFKQVDRSLSRNTEGTGVGLSLVKSIVELHGGNIYAQSEFGKGSKFTVLLPVAKIFQESKLYKSNVRSENENILVELSDIYS